MCRLIELHEGVLSIPPGRVFVKISHLWFRMHNCPQVQILWIHATRRIYSPQKQIQYQYRFSWDEIRNMLSQKTRDERLPESDRLAAAYGFIDPKYTTDQGGLPNP